MNLFKNKIVLTGGIVLVIGLGLFLTNYLLFGPVSGSDKEVILTVAEDDGYPDIIKLISDQNLIKNPAAFKFIVDAFINRENIKPGGYKLNKKMTSWQILKKVMSKPDLLWVTISNCERKEQIGEKLAKIFNWSNEQLEEWNNLYKGEDYFEGVYYPDTYLIPANDSVTNIAKRFIDRFSEKFAPLSDKFIENNIKWTTGLKIASLISREAAGKSDMKLISGIIWNRLDKEMALQIDSTMQYTRGKDKNGLWWGSISIKEKESDSPYNTYLYKGLPPTPICSPSIDFMEAVLNPEKTDCLFYLHDNFKQIYCAKTYEEHLANIEKYLK